MKFYSTLDGITLHESFVMKLKDLTYFCELSKKRQSTKR